MALLIKIPHGEDTSVDAAKVLVIREPLPAERHQNPGVLATIWIGGAKIFSIESIDELLRKFDPLTKLARLSAPNNAVLLVGMDRVIDVDDASVLEAPGSTSVLRFGAEPRAPRQAVRESRNELKVIWQAAGLPTSVFD